MAGSFNFGEWISARSVIGDTLDEIGKTNEKLFVCTPDVGMNLKRFREHYPDRYLDVGIAEQNCVGVAAGLALEGNIPVIMGMLPFLSMRSCEQVRTAVCYQNLPVRIIGTGGGLTSGGGSTHNAMEDIAILKSMVNMTVLSIGDPNMIRDILHLSMDYAGPMYIRLAQGKKDRQLYEPGTIEYKIGGSVTARDGKDFTILAHGEMVGEALDVAEELAKEGIDVRVIDMGGPSDERRPGQHAVRLLHGQPHPAQVVPPVRHPAGLRGLRQRGGAAPQIRLRRGRHRRLYPLGREVTLSLGASCSCGAGRNPFPLGLAVYPTTRR